MYSIHNTKPTTSYGFPAQQPAKIAVQTTRTYLAENERSIKVIFCCFSPVDLTRYHQLINH